MTYAARVLTGPALSFESLDGLRAARFVDFALVSRLRHSLDPLPKVRGVYMVLRLRDDQPSFRGVSPAGWFKGKDPTIPIAELQQRWVVGTPVVYIGKAGGPTSQATLRGRIQQYLRHGAGERVGHWGGRPIWQLEDCEDLAFCWKPMLDGEPRKLEQELIATFMRQFGRRPFANRRG